MLRFGRIDYLNLLPFHVFMKRYIHYSQAKMMLRHGANVPAVINRDFARRRVDAAFISSIRARHARRAKLGIVAEAEVRSVLVLPGDHRETDAASETSNALAAILGVRGRVIIGDPALRTFLEGAETIDLAAVWHARTGLPFVFAVLCYRGNQARIQRLERAFLRGRVPIPHYLLAQAARRSGIAPSQIRAYLQLIRYELGHREQRALRLFWKLAERDLSKTLKIQ